MCLVVEYKNEEEAGGGWVSAGSLNTRGDAKNEKTGGG